MKKGFSEKDKRKQFKELKTEIETLYEEKREQFEQMEGVEKKKRREMIEKKVSEEREKMKLSPELEKEAEEQAKEIEKLGKKRKISQLFDLADEKGIHFAVEIARKMKDPYLLDIFHDLLAREGFYKGFLKSTDE
ncbi:MAG: hypothetical protein GF370_04890 [Candidatus Nealsonbacteria bacterium]|nr:hypothetical protein [Candidatus Nealsonbacteria bacterium]